MKPNDFEIGKVYQTDENSNYYTLVRISQQHVVCLQPDANIVSEANSGGWGGDYEEISLSDLNEKGKEVYLKHFPNSEPADCTCSNDQIFNGGCKCGAFQKETA